VRPGRGVPVASVSRMQRIDEEAIGRFRIPRLLLMEHAGLALAHTVHHLLPDPTAPLLVCCGTGYNGGDGLAAARHLALWGYRPCILIAGSLEGLREECAAFAAMARAAGLVIESPPAPGARGPHARAWSEYGGIIDALLGIGLRGEVRQPERDLIEAINGSGAPVIAADVPSGLDADSGRPLGAAIRAAATIAFGLPKRGCLAPGAAAYTGRLFVHPIGIPPSLLEPEGP